MRAWFDLRQIDIHRFVQLLGLSSLDRINALESQGWLSCDADALMIHPLIAQIVKKQPISAAMRRSPSCARCMGRCERRSMRCAGKACLPDAESLRF